MKIVFAVICRKASNAAHHDAVSVHEAGRTRVPVLHMHKAKFLLPRGTGQPEFIAVLPSPPQVSMHPSHRPAAAAQCRSLVFLP
eukprot:763876-Rhodomonas_salina.3